MQGAVDGVNIPFQISRLSKEGHKQDDLKSTFSVQIFIIHHAPVETDGDFEGEKKYMIRADAQFKRKNRDETYDFSTLYSY